MLPKFLAVSLLLAFTAGRIWACDSCGCGLTTGVPGGGEVEHPFSAQITAERIYRTSSAPRTIDPLQTREVFGPHRDAFSALALSVRIPLGTRFSILVSLPLVASSVESSGLSHQELRVGDVSLGMASKFLRTRLGPVLFEGFAGLQGGLPLYPGPSSNQNLRLSQNFQISSSSFSLNPSLRAVFSWEFLVLNLESEARWNVIDQEQYQTGPALSFGGRIGVKPMTGKLAAFFPFAGLRYQMDGSDQWRGLEVPDSGSVSVEARVGLEFRLANVFAVFRYGVSLYPLISPVENGRLTLSVGITGDFFSKKVKPRI